MSLGDPAYTQAKNRKKRARTVIQIVICLALLALLVDVLCTFTTYRPYDESAVAMGGTEGEADTGFIALSYFGVDRKGESNTLIGKGLLRDHLQVLHDQGYVTVTQQDVDRYYREGKPLPKRSLFLMFEDGRRDTAIFSQKILENLNFKASMMSYAENFERGDDPTFLSPGELRELVGSSYWETGTQGYRMRFINVFDRYDNYIGELDPRRFSMLRPALSRRYNHYLMDFVRDKYGVPKESVNRMKARISYDYERLRDIYSQELGAVPGLYVLMHGNTGGFGNNRRVSQLNGQWIRQLFKLNFNREGYSFNQRDSSVYDLTRMQPQPDWSRNHLLMRLKYDINQPLTFVSGDAERAAEWEVLMGAAEMKGEQYVLTSLPESRGLARLKNSGGFGDVYLKTQLRGNRFGEQAVYLRANDDLTRYVAVRLMDGELLVGERVGDQSREIFREKLSVLFGEVPPSVEEDRRAVEVLELETFARYADSPAQAKEYAAQAIDRQQQPAATVEEGAAPYEGVSDRNERFFQWIAIDLVGDTITVRLDDKTAVDSAPVKNTGSGSLCLESGWSGQSWSQRNLADDVYDGRFQKLTVAADPKGDLLLYTTELQGWEKWKARAGESFEGLLDWFMKYM